MNRIRSYMKNSWKTHAAITSVSASLLTNVTIKIVSILKNDTPLAQTNLTQCYSTANSSSCRCLFMRPVIINTNYNSCVDEENIYKACVNKFNNNSKALIVLISTTILFGHLTLISYKHSNRPSFYRKIIKEIKSSRLYDNTVMRLSKATYR
jgi:hypothetical protein